LVALAILGRYLLARQPQVVIVMFASVLGRGWPAVPVLSPPGRPVQAVPERCTGQAMEVEGHEDFRQSHLPPALAVSAAAMPPQRAQGGRPCLP